MPNPRDIFLQQLQPKFDSKENRFEPFPAVLTNSLGRTDSGSIWKSENAQLAYFRAYGGGALSWVLCDRLVNPRLGLGVLIQYNQYIRQYEVIRDNPIQRNDDSEPTSELILTNNDLLKGGRFQLWLDPTMFIPLSIYPTGADTVNVVSGDYIYQGERKTYAGAVNQDLSGSRPAAGLHRLVGLYLDAANTLQTIDGATIAVGSDAAEPTWPAGAFRLGVVDIDNATDISIDNIDNRKVIYTEDDSLLSGAWPPPLKIYRWDVSTGLVIIEDSLSDAVTNLGAGDIIVLGEGDYALTSTLAISTACTILGSHWRTTRILGDIDGPVINFSAGCNMQNIKIENDPTTGDGTAVTVTNATCRFDRVWFYAQSPDDVADGLRLTSTSATTRAYCRDCQSEAYPDTTGYAVNVSQATGTVEAYLFDGYYIGEFNFISNSLCTLYDCIAEDTPTVLNGAGSYYGQYRDFNGVARYVGDDTPAASDVPIWDDTNSRWVPGAAAVIADTVTKTVRSVGGDFTTIQDAIDWFAGKFAIDCIIDVEAGTYVENLIVADYLSTDQNGLTIQGDTRALAGMGYIDNLPANRLGTANLGSGTVSLSNAGNDITIAMSVTNPTLTSYGNGDKILVLDNAGSWTEETISSVAANVITLTGAAPTVGNTGTAVVFLPNRIIDGTGISFNVQASCTIQGFLCRPGTSWSILTQSSGITITVESCVLDGEGSNRGIALQAVSDIFCYLQVSAVRGVYGYFAQAGSMTAFYNSCAIDCTSGYYVQYPAFLYAYATQASECTTYGYRATFSAVMDAQLSGAVNCGTGHRADYKGYVNATSSNAFNSGNGTDYSPAASDTEGNVDGIITWS